MLRTKKRKILKFYYTKSNFFSIQQSLTSNVRPSEHQQWEDEEENSSNVKRKIPKTPQGPPVSPPKAPSSHYIRNQPHMSMLNRYLHITTI